MIVTAFAGLSNSFAGLVAQTAPHVVEVESRRSLASGFVWRDGFVVTPDESLAEEGAVRIETADGTVLDAEVVGATPRPMLPCSAWPGLFKRRWPLTSSRSGRARSR